MGRARLLLLRTVGEGGDTAGGGEQTTLPGLINLSDEPRKAEPAARGHGIENGPELRLQRDRGSVARQID